MSSGRQADFERLREQYPFFEYRHFEAKTEKKGLRLTFTFNLSDKYSFQPSLFFQAHPLLAVPDQKTLDNLAFNIGMIELISYWKAACSPLIIVRPFRLPAPQLEFWKSLYWNGLGEFFHTNGIRCDESSFLKIEATEGNVVDPFVNHAHDKRVLVPVGGGKDSAVSLELLASSGHEVIPFMLNPSPAMLRIIQASGTETSLPMAVNRSLDPQLIDLNAKGFLNGHTPFSALLAFVTSAAAVLTQTKHIALSNESSANEATIPGTHINHQYSKSLHFESSFRAYLAEYLTPTINYFSLLRPLNELQIAWLFSRMPQYHSAFRSCNAGSKTDSWCGQCPKCLFTYTILSPFLGQSDLVRIFGKDLLSDTTMLPLLESLAGLTTHKPFECVGTVSEVQACLNYLNQRNQGQLHDLPHLLETRLNPQQQVDTMLRGFDPHHHLTSHFENLLRSSLND